MKNILQWMLGVLLSLSFSAQAQSPSVTEVDVCVYGGTSAGVIAAYTARQLGKTVILIEPGKHVGGLSSGGLGYTDIGNKYAVTGIARDFYRRIGAHYGKFEQWIFEPHVAEKIFQDYIRTANVNVLYGHRLSKVNSKNGYIADITIEQSSNVKAQTRTVRAKQFIDCSYEGDLMAKAGVKYFVGRESNALYKETYNGVQIRDKHQFPEGIDPYKIPGKPESGLLWGIKSEILPPAGSGDKKVQAYNYRICLSSDLANQVPITVPDDYDSTRYELLIRLLQKEPNRPFNLILKPDLMPNHKTDINNNGPFSTDMIGMNYNYPEASYEDRNKIAIAHENYVKGLLYFIGHSGRMPAHLKREMLRWGYPKDEYTDNGHWSPQMYVREARRMIGAYVMTQANCEGKETVSDAVGMAAYTMDSHNTSRVVINGMVKNEGDVQVGGFPPYPISYRSLIPNGTECKNLFVPVCLSATHIAYGSIRMEPVFMVLAQSSAVAAVQAIDKKIAVQQVDVKAVQQILTSNPLADGSTPELLLDNDHAAVSKTGTWQLEKSAKGSYGPTYLHAMAGSNAPVQSVKYSPVIEQEGLYKIYLYVPKVEGASDNVTIIVKAGKKNQTIVMKPNEVRVEGQTSGEWMPLGEFEFLKGKGQSLEITTSNANGVVIADAALFVKVASKK